MKEHDWDRAFPQTPEIVHEKIEQAFWIGRKRVRRRNILTGSLCACAALLVMAWVARTALAPRQDVLGNGKLTPTSSKAVTAEQYVSPTPIATVEPTVAPTAEDVEIAVDPVYYCTSSGLFYHADEHCSGMMNASEHTLSEIMAMGKEACPICLLETEENAVESADALETTVYATRNGTYFHTQPDCSGMMGAQAYDIQYALSAGKIACPLCYPCVMTDSQSIEEYLVGLFEQCMGIEYPFTDGDGETNIYAEDQDTLCMRYEMGDQAAYVECDLNAGDFYATMTSEKPAQLLTFTGLLTESGLPYMLDEIRQIAAALGFDTEVVYSVVVRGVLNDSLSRVEATECSVVLGDAQKNISISYSLD